MIITTRYSTFGSVARAAVAAAGLMLLATGSAVAQPPSRDVTCGDLVLSGTCDQELATLCSAIENSATPPLKQRDKDGMIGKTVGTSIKLFQGRTDDATQKLGDIQQKLDQLTGANKTKIADGDADAIQTALTAAQICVDLLP